jgi:hypothetical protein
MATKIHFIGSEPPLVVSDDFATVQAALTAQQSVQLTRTDGGRSAQVFRDAVAYIEDEGAVPAPSATIEPAAGPSAGGITVIISGSGFTGAVDVTFGGTSATSMNVDSDSQITAVTPPGSGTVDVLVVAPVPTGGPGVAAGQFTYY